MLFSAFVAFAPFGAASAQDSYPTKPIEIFLTYSPGGSADNIARILQPALSAELGVPVQVTNNPPPRTAENVFSRSPADGTLISIMSPGSVASNNTFFDVPYDGKTFQWIAGLVESPAFLFVAKNSGLDDIDAIRARAAEHPIRIAATSKYLSPVLACSILFDELQIPFTIVTGYQSNAETVTAVLRGEADVVPTLLGSASSFIDSGDLTGVVALQSGRSADLPDVASLQDIGASDNAGRIGTAAFVLVAPPGTDAAILDRLDSAVGTVLKEPDVAERIEKAGYHVAYLGRNDVGDLVDRIYTAFGLAKGVMSKIGD